MKSRKVAFIGLCSAVILAMALVAEVSAQAGPAAKPPRPAANAKQVVRFVNVVL